MEKTKKKRLVMSEPLILAIELLDDDSDRMSLISALIAYGKGENVATDDMYSYVEKVFKYLTDSKRQDSIYIDDLPCFD